MIRLARHRTRRTWATVALAASPIFAAGSIAAWAWVADGFPHERHAGLFPLCQGCHGPVGTEASAPAYPAPERCAACHDGQARPAVDWSRPAPPATTLRFDHADHARRAGARGDAPTCADCHGVPGRSEPMAVGRAAPEACAGCHEEAREHPDGGTGCATCHRPVSRVDGLTPERIEAFPRPASHDDPGFLSSHGPVVGVAESVCATCHARESCSRCHLDAGAPAAVAALDPDARVAGLVAGRPPRYPTPRSHQVADWRWRHGDEAVETDASCGNCHARQSCTTCHRSGLPAIEALPSAPPGDPRGRVVAASGTRVHDPGFATHHGADAATLESTCASCHEQDFCSSCHAGAETPAFHGPNYAATHAVGLYGSEADCSSCHNPELFCRSCHAGSGLTANGTLDSGFHNRQPFWLLSHGRAARRGLEGCVSCHAQTDCARCHSPLGGWGIDPHGPGFDASRYDRASTGCILCHRGQVRAP